MSIISIVMLYILVLVVFVVSINFRWCIITLRRIANPKNKGGYLRLVQIGIISVLIAMFILISIEYLQGDYKVDKVDVVFTVVVGWLGLIIGSFFGETAMETSNQSHKLDSENMRNKMERLIHVNTKQGDIINKNQQIEKHTWKFIDMS